MGETKKKEQPTKRRRQLFGLGKSSSDSEIARSKGSVKERWPFPQSLTVDELARYRRRRVQGRPKDTLCKTEGSLTNIITEYRRAFRASSEDLSKKLDPAVFGIPKRLGPVDNLVVADAERVMESRTESSRFIPHLNAPGRPPQLRRGTSLKREGKFSSDTEQSSYVAHAGNHRAELARRPTSLKMEGDMSMRSENCDNYIEWLNVGRPEIARPFPSHLKLEGDIETSTENHEKYVPFVGARRPEILRQSANLRMEGESRYVPEYTEVFKDHNIRGKRSLKKPETHLRSEGNFYNTTETSEQFVNPKKILESVVGKLDTDDEDDDGDLDRNPVDIAENNDVKIERLHGSYGTDIKGLTPLEIPEYRDAYKDFPRERPKLMKPGDEIGRSDGSKISSASVNTGSKFPTKIDMDPEYKSKFLDLSTNRESPVYRKPPLALRPSAVSTNNYNVDTRRRSRRSSPSEDPGVGQRQRHFDTTEVRSQYVPYGNIPRVESVKMPTNLQLEGNIDLQPEYRNAYCNKRNYNVSTDQPRMHRRRERSSSESRRRDNYWTNNSLSDGENFRPSQIYHKDDDPQDAFRILKTTVHDDVTNVVGKPPSGSRRSSLVNRPTSHVEETDGSLLRRRSPSPTYRLHVCNVDDEPRGFGRGKIQRQSGEVGLTSDSGVPDSKSVDTVNYHRRSYSPSFGRRDPTKSFVVLPDHINNQNGRKEPVKYGGPNTADFRGRNRGPVPSGNSNLIDHNSNGVNHTKREQFRPRNRTPPNWMRPWYDNAAGWKKEKKVVHRPESNRRPSD